MKLALKLTTALVAVASITVSGCSTGPDFGHVRDSQRRAASDGLQTRHQGVFTAAAVTGEGASSETGGDGVASVQSATASGGNNGAQPAQSRTATYDTSDGGSEGPVTASTTTSVTQAKEAPTVTTQTAKQEPAASTYNSQEQTTASADPAPQQTTVSGSVTRTTSISLETAKTTADSTVFSSKVHD